MATRINPFENAYRNTLLRGSVFAFNKSNDPALREALVLTMREQISGAKHYRPNAESTRSIAKFGAQMESQLITGGFK